MHASGFWVLPFAFLLSCSLLTPLYARPPDRPALESGSQTPCSRCGARNRRPFPPTSAIRLKRQNAEGTSSGVMTTNIQVDSSQYALGTLKPESLFKLTSSSGPGGLQAVLAMAESNNKMDVLTRYLGASAVNSMGNSMVSRLIDKLSGGRGGSKSPTGSGGGFGGSGTSSGSGGTSGSSGGSTGTGYKPTPGKTPGAANPDDTEY